MLAKHLVYPQNQFFAKIKHPIVEKFGGLWPEIPHTSNIFFLGVLVLFLAGMCHRFSLMPTALNSDS
jgi:hypothetical protein